MLRLEYVDLVRKDPKTVEVWADDSHLFDLTHLTDEHPDGTEHDEEALNHLVTAALRGYNAGLSQGELAGRETFKAEVRDLLGFVSKSESKG